jgi:C-terminal processing protease CtpA/Prc
MPGEEVVGVDGKPVGERIERVRDSISAATEEHRLLWATLRALAGPRGSASQWLVRKADGSTRTVRLKHTRFMLGNLDWRPKGRMLTDGVLYVNISTFGQPEVPKDIARILTKHSDARALVLDLRANGGGSNLISDAVISHLLPPGTPLAQYHHGSSVRQTRAEDWQPGFKAPVAVLTSPWTCSAAETCAGLLQGYGRAAVVGETPCGGAGIPHVRLLLPGDYVLKIVSGWTTWPDGSGTFPVRPDLPVKPTPAAVTAGRWSAAGDPAKDEVLHQALQYLATHRHPPPRRLRWQRSGR